MVKIDIKPLSVNRAWKGRRFKTQAYKDYERAMLLMLPKNYKIPDGDLHIVLRFGMSNKLSDFDNGIKNFIDILQKKYKFDDRRIFRGIIEKEIVKKGEEFVEFSIVQYHKNV